MTLYVPIIYQFSNLGETIDYLLDSQHSPSILIFCGEQEAFIQQLVESVQKDEAHTKDAVAGDNEDAAVKTRFANSCRPLRTRTLRRIAKADTIKTAFCTSVPALHAYLSTLPRGVSTQPQEPVESRTDAPLLMIVNPVALHNGTATYSAQGLSRAFAAAFEAALRSEAQLGVVEYFMSDRRGGEVRPTYGSTLHDLERDEQGTSERGIGGDGNEEESSEGDPWELEVPILNATTKTFGVGGVKAVLGRSVKIRTIAERWFAFQSR